MLNAPPPPPDAKRRSDGAPISPIPMSPKLGSGPTSPSKPGVPASPKFATTKPQISPRVGILYLLNFTFSKFDLLVKQFQHVLNLT